MQRIKSKFKAFLNQASEALNKSLTGTAELFITLDVGQEKLTSNPGLFAVLLTGSLNKEENRGYIFISNELKAELIASWVIIEDNDEISLTINKVQESYNADDAGMIQAINDILSQKSIMEKALQLKKGMPSF